MRYTVEPFQPGRDHPFLNNDQLYRIIDTKNRVALPGCSTNKEKMENAAKLKNEFNDQLITLQQQQQQRLQQSQSLEI